MKHYSKSIKILLFALIVTELFIMTIHPVYADSRIQLNQGFSKAWTDLFNEYKVQLVGFIGFGLATSILAFVINFLRLAQNATNPQQRSHVLKELIVIAVTTALLGSVGIIMGIFYNIF
jgi:hypothetical protein